MRRHLILFTCLMASVFLPSCGTQHKIAAPVDESETPSEWHWSREKASLAYCIKQHLQDFEVECVRENEYYTPINIRTKKDRKLIYSIEEGHQSTVFARWNETLFIAEYCPIDTGCEVVAVDLKTGNKLWKSPLQGIGPIGHYKYWNRVNIEADVDRIIVTGNEAAGRYVEYLDLESGKALGNKQFAPEPKSLRDE